MFAGFRAAAEKGKFGGVEIFRTDFLEGGGHGGRHLGGFDHGAIAGRENAGQRGDGQLDRKVPGRDDADDPFGLIFYLCAGARQPHRKRHFALLGLHPARDMFQRMLDRRDAAADIRQHRLLMATMAKIIGHCLNELFGVVDDHGGQALQTVLAYG